MLQKRNKYLETSQAKSTQAPSEGEQRTFPKLHDPAK